MTSLSESQLLLTLLALGVVVLSARAGGEVARRLHQPEVLGELFAGFLLGPSIFGAIFPHSYQALFLTPIVGSVLSGFSWLGAIFVLLLAGIEVDLQILRAEAKPGAFAAAGAIVPMLAAGIIIAHFFLHRPLNNSFFFGIVLSVTAISVVAKILIERDALRRRYAQVIVAAGIVSEVFAWLLISTVTPVAGTSPGWAALRSLLFALAFFMVMLTVGRNFTFWAMRRVSDDTQIVKGQLSLVLVLTLLAAALTQALGLHALLGAFAFGVLLGQAPRRNKPLLESLQTMSTSFFAPIFFALAGMRVNLLQLRTPANVLVLLILFVVITLLKISLSAIGARLGGLHLWEALLVGTGLNAKGGTDVIVAIVGVELGLISGQLYTMYAVIAILTVLFMPSLMRFLEGKTPPTTEEAERLESEEAERRAYVPAIERVLVPVAPILLPSLTADIMEHIAVAKRDRHQIFDITEFLITDQIASPASLARQRQFRKLTRVSTLENVEMTQHQTDTRTVLADILAASKDHDLIVTGAHPRERLNLFSFGKLQDAIIQQAQADVLVVASQQEHFSAATVHHILVPTNGMEYSMAAGDIAAYVALGYDAEVVLMHTISTGVDAVLWRDRDQARLRMQGEGIVQELAFRIKRLGVRVSTRITVGASSKAILRELNQRPYELVVMGGIDRGTHNSLYLGNTIQTVVTRGKTPTLTLITHNR